MDLAHPKLQHTLPTPSDNSTRIIRVLGLDVSSLTCPVDSRWPIQIDSHAWFLSGIMPPRFPADIVVQAYMNPVVDKSSERFTWGVPDVEGLVIFCAQHIGWAAGETRKLLEPVVARSGQRYRQTRLDSFMKYEDSIKFADVRSKRLRAVLGFDSVNDKGDEKEGKRRKNDGTQEH